jgi:hypothetical protein
MRGTILGTALAALTVTRAFAADPLQGATVHVGDGTLTGDFLQPYNNAWFYTAKMADGTVHPEGIWTDHMQWTDVGGRRVMLRLQGITFVNGLSASTINVFDPKTLAPIKTEKHNIDGTIFRRTFDGPHITSVTLKNASDKTAPKSTDLPEAVFDFNGGLYGILLAALPMKAGFAGSLPAVADFDDVLSVENFHVLREEPVRAGSHGMVKSWVVESVKSGNYRMTFWITKAPPYIIRLVYDDLENKRVLSWDML